MSEVRRNYYEKNLERSDGCIGNHMLCTDDVSFFCGLSGSAIEATTSSASPADGENYLCESGPPGANS